MHIFDDSYIQLICPVMFDQEHWGELIQWKGLGCVCNRLSRVTGPELTVALGRVLLPAVRLAALAMADSLKQEDGLGQALGIIESHLCKHEFH